MTYEPLLNTIMSFTILYKACTKSLEQETVHELLMYRANYLKATLQAHRQELCNLDERIADAASLTSVILGLDAFASLRERHFRPLVPYEPPIAWLEMCKGVRNVTKMSMDTTKGDPNALMHRMAENTANLIEPSLIFREEYRARFPYLLERRSDEIEAETDWEVYRNTVSYIGAVTAAREANEERRQTSRRLIIFPIIIPARFTDLLKERRPRALVILAHYFALAASFSDFWWIGDSPVQEIRAIQPCLSPDWQGAMTWPLQMVEGLAQTAR